MNQIKYLNLTKIFEAIDSGIVKSITAGTLEDYTNTGATLYKNKQFCNGAFIMSKWDEPIAYIELDTGATIIIKDTTETPLVSMEAYRGNAPEEIQTAYDNYSKKTMKKNK